MPEPISDACRIVGSRMRGERLRLGLSQDEVANLAHMNVSNYGKIERGLNNPTLHTIVRIAFVLGVDPGEFVMGLSEDSLPAPEVVFSAREFVRERTARVRN